MHRSSSLTSEFGRTSLRGAFKRPGQSRLYGVGNYRMDWLDLQDGQTLWHAMPGRQEFCLPQPIRHWHPQEAPIIVAGMLPYEKITRGLKSAKVVGRAELIVAGQAVQAMVVRAHYSPLKSMFGTQPTAVVPSVYWINAVNHIVLQHSYKTTTRVLGNVETRTTTVSLTGYERNVDLPDRLFQFASQGMRESTCLAMSSGD